MTASYQLPLDYSSHFSFRSRPVNAMNISVVVPVYQDWDGLRVTLESLHKLSPPPKTVTVVNDGSQGQPPVWLEQFPGSLVNCTGNHGPAYARNTGFGFRSEMPFEKSATLVAFPSPQGMPSYLKRGYDPRLKYQDWVPNPRKFEWDSEVDWFYFTDCGCKHPRDLFRSFERTWQREGDSTVAICGPVHGEGDGLINQYMTKEGILHPPMEDYLYGKRIPQSVITANVLVNGLAFSYLGGFDIDFTEAAGEDLDLGLRLRALGMIAWSPDARVTHRFEEDLADFMNRFRRYGRGNRMLEVKHNLPSLRPSHFKVAAEFQELADLQVKMMQEGYDEAAQKSERGVLLIP